MPSFSGYHSFLFNKAQHNDALPSSSPKIEKRPGAVNSTCTTTKEASSKPGLLSQKTPNQYTVVTMNTSCQPIYLQEVFARASPAGGHGASVIRDSAENLEVGLQVFAEGHDRGDVTAAVAVVGSRPDSDNFLRLEVIFVAFVYKLMGSSDEFEVVDVVELEGGNVSMLCRERSIGDSSHTSEDTFSPNSQPAPLGETAHVSTSSGSDQTRSQKAPS